MNKKFTAIFVLIIMSLMILPACSPKGETPEQATTNALNAIRDMKTSIAKRLPDWVNTSGPVTLHLLTGVNVF